MWIPDEVLVKEPALLQTIFRVGLAVNVFFYCDSRFEKSATIKKETWYELAWESSIVVPHSSTRRLTHRTTNTMDVALFVASFALARAFLVAEGRTMGQSSSKKDAASEASPATLLLQAAMEANLAQIQALVSQYTTTTTTTTNNNESLDVAKFLSQATDVAAGSNTAMHGAVFGGHLEIVQYLHQHAGVASLTAPNGLGCTPLWLAAGYDRSDILEYLLQYLPNVSQALLETNSTGDTPLLAAASRGHAKICHRLLASATASTNEGDSHPASCATSMIQTTNQNRDSPLAVAIAAGVQDEILLARLCDSAIRNLTNTKGITPLLLACEGDHLLAANILLETNEDGDKTSILSANADSSGNCDSPLGVAAFCGSERVLQRLLSQHKELSVSVDPIHPRTGCTPLFLAVRAGHVACARQLLEAGADASISNHRLQGLTPRQAAEKYKARPEMLELLLVRPTHTNTPSLSASLL